MTNNQIQFFSAFFALQLTNDQNETFVRNKHNRLRFRPHCAHRFFSMH